MISDEFSAEQEELMSRDHSSSWQSLKDRGSSGLTKDEYGLLMTMDKAMAAEQEMLFDNDQDGVRVASMFCSLVSLVKSSEKEQQLRYVLLWLRTLLSQNQNRGNAFFTRDSGSPLKPFFDVCYRSYSLENEIVANALVTASLIIGSGDHSDQHLEDVGKKIRQCLLHVSKQDAHGDDYFVESIALALKNCLKNPYMMEIMVGENFADVLCAFINNQSSFQTLYYAGFSLLLVALKPAFAPNLVNPQLCKAMINQVSSARKEKVRRVYLQALDCMLTEEKFAEMTVMYGLYPVLQRLTEENFKDEDIPALVDSMIIKLRPQVRVMSSMERFGKELATKILEWGPVHTETFWKKNFMKFENNEFSMIKDLCALLDSHNEETVKVAAFDIGEFARLYPDGRRVVTTFGGKEKLFNILSRQGDLDDDLRKHILLATQKLLVVSWQNIE